MTPDRAIPKGRLLYLIPRELSQTVSTALTFRLGISRMDLWSQGITDKK